VRKKKRSPIREHNLRKPSSLPLKKENKNDSKESNNYQF